MKILDSFNEFNENKWDKFLDGFDKSKITGKNTFNGDHFEIEGNHGSSKDEKTLFWVFLQIVTSALTLRPRKTFIYVFQAFFGFCNF